MCSSFHELNWNLGSILKWKTKARLSVCTGKLMKVIETKLKSFFVGTSCRLLYIYFVFIYSLSLFPLRCAFSCSYTSDFFRRYGLIWNWLMRPTHSAKDNISCSIFILFASARRDMIENRFLYRCTRILVVTCIS